MTRRSSGSLLERWVVQSQDRCGNCGHPKNCQVTQTPETEPRIVRVFFDPEQLLESRGGEKDAEKRTQSKPDRAGAEPGTTWRISEATFYNWKKQYAGMGIAELAELRQLREENGKLKRW